MGGEILGDLRTTDALPNRGMLIIHGAGNWVENYWEKIAQDVRNLVQGVAQSFTPIGIYYADVKGTASASTPETAPRIEDFKNTFLDELLRDRLMAAVSTVSGAELWKKAILAALPGSASILGALLLAPRLVEFARAPNSLLDVLTHSLLNESLIEARTKIEKTPKPAETDIGSAIEDVYRYLYDAAFANRVRQKLIAALKRAQNFPNTVLISHSLGTVVAFDVLNAWTESTPKISHWFTLGCPLPKVLRLRPGTPNQLKNPNVTHWYNVYDSTDLVAGPVGPHFTKAGYPVHDIYVDIADDPVGSHDYFHNRATLNMIADVMG